MIGIQQNIPLFYLYVGAFALFAAVSSGLLRFNEWKIVIESLISWCFTEFELIQNWMKWGYGGNQFRDKCFK